MKIKNYIRYFAVFIICVSPTYSAVVNFVLSAPQVQVSGYPVLASETFDLMGTGNMSLAGGTFGLGNYSITRFVMPSNYPQIRDADKWGGSTGTGKYLFTGSSEIIINLNASAKYIGFWWTGVGDDDTVKVYGYENGTENLFATYTSSDLSNVVGSKVAPKTVIAENGLSYSGSSYYGNPNSPSTTGDYIYGFINIKLADSALSFSKISFSGINFELDSVITSIVPEPSALSLLAVGLGGLAMMRRRRS